MSLAPSRQVRRRDPAPHRWTYDLDALWAAGVRISDAQAALLDSNTRQRDVLIPFALADPIANDTGERNDDELPRLVTRDLRGVNSQVVIPAIGYLDWGLDASGAEDLEMLGGADWVRFPSVPVKVWLPSTGDDLELHAHPMRIWDVVPLDICDEDLVAEFTNVSELCYDAGWYATVRRFWAANYNHPGHDVCDLAGPAEHCWHRNPKERGQYDCCACELLSACPAASAEIPRCQHRHGPDGTCFDGYDALETLRGKLFVDDQLRHYRPVDFTVPLHRDDTRSIWADLVATSMHNWKACFDVVPPWERWKLALNEGRYCPWGLS